MIEKIKALCIKYREILVYIIVGGMTTVVSWAVKFLFNFLFFGGTLYPTAGQNITLSVVEWVAGVLFAYPTNRRFVFQSTNPDIFREFVGFVVSRISTLLIGSGLNLLLGWLGVNVYVYTIISAVFVVIGNYVFSKLFVFKKKDETAPEEDGQSPC